MTSSADPADPRPGLASALDQVEHQLAELGPAELARPTPCAEFDVRMLIAHLVAVLRKLTLVRGGGDMTTVADPAVDLPDDGREALRRARTELEIAWGPSSDLDAEYAVAWGRMTGRALLDAYTHEFTVHAWDLARASGQADALDPDLAEAALTWFRANVPEEGRDEGGPFAPAVTISDDADPYARLAAYVGRTA